MATGCCTALAGRAKNCLGNRGGLRRVWMACRNEVTSITIANDDTDAVTAITPATVFHEYELLPETSFFTSTYNYSRDTGAKYWDTQLTIQLEHLDIPLRQEILAMAGSDLLIIAEDNNGVYHMFGYEDGFWLAGDTVYQSGQAWTDLNGATPVLEGAENKPPYIVTDEAMAPIITGAA